MLKEHCSPSYIYGLLRALSFQNICWIFLSNLYISPWLGKNFKFMIFRSLENTFASQKIESNHFYSCFQCKTHPQVLIITTRQREITLRELKKWPKLHLKSFISLSLKQINFVVPAITSQAKLSSHYFFHSHRVWLWNFPKC